MRNLGLTDGLKAAVKADTISLMAFQVGMYAVMALNQLVLFERPPEPDTAAYWFLMQIAMIAGFVTSYPANWWLVKTGHQGGDVGDCPSRTGEPCSWLEGSPMAGPSARPQPRFHGNRPVS